VSAPRAPEPLPQDLAARWAASGQAHVFRFWDRLDAAARRRLAAQAARMDPARLVRERAEAQARPPVDPAELAPAEVLRHPARGGDPDRPEALRERGAALLAAGRVAVVTVAGGQGTRLGFAGPKGAYPLGPVTGRTLFGIHAQRIRGLGRRHGRAVPWVLMTSPANDAATREHFAAHARHGLAPGDLLFACQGTLPAFDAAGRIALAAPDRIFEAPDGHGGVFAALAASGALEALAARGVDRLFYHHVDNPLVRVGDPTFLGLHDEAGAEMSCKVIARRDALEQTGLLVQRRGRPAVIEYSELPPEVADLREPDGGLRYWAGSIGIHVLDMAFARRLAQTPEALPLHLAPKPVPVVDERGRPHTPEAPKGHKLERFVFDGLAWAGAVAVMEVLRRDEYAPVKNAEGEASPASARRDLVAGYRRWIRRAGLESPRDDAVIEMDHAHLDGPDDLRRSGIRDVADGAPHVRIATGAE